ncbi:helix-turn-helix domain-containing protein [Actinokineospora xionganensis]|uniref:helix-turn-helix domain-containing protein n=1 Tax=Actinokineospora xionganensis TaxID=2684470 RepID=UPI0028AF7167|nr:helix-turn-helix domain-containing protein [Actinokineospora xionganensis]
MTTVDGRKRTPPVDSRECSALEDWAEIRRLHRAERMPTRSIARQLGIGRNTVRRALAADGPPKYRRPAKGSIVDAVEPQIRQLLAQWPTMPATVTAERISSTRSLTVLKDRVAGVAAVVLPTGPGVADRLPPLGTGPA